MPVEQLRLWAEVPPTPLRGKARCPSRCVGVRCELPVQHPSYHHGHGAVGDMWWTRYRPLPKDDTP